MYTFNPLLSHVMRYIEPINYIKNVLIKFVTREAFENCILIHYIMLGYTAEF